MRFISWLISWPTDIYRILRPAGGNLRSLNGDELDAFMREMYPENYWSSLPAENVFTLNLRVGVDDGD